ncbi:MAG: hypothetical protein WD512_13775 [Candidatus Paceibacterota bacterium]
MKEDEFVAQVQELLTLNDFQKRLENLTRKAFRSGAFETEEAKPGDFRKAKVVLCAIFQEMQWQYKPFNDEDRKEVEELNKMI